MENRKVIVIGAGIGGLSAGYWLGQRGYDVEILEALDRPGGRMAFSIPHPCTDTPYREWQADEAGQTIALGIGRYFESGPMMSHWTMQRLAYHWHTPCWHYTLAEWSELIAEAGLAVQRLHEPRPTAEHGTRYPALENARLVPAVLIFALASPSRRER